jgi:hypothetical protein
VLEYNFVLLKTLMVNSYIEVMVSITFLIPLFFDIYLFLLFLSDSTMVTHRECIRRYCKTNFIDHLFWLVRFHNACLKKHSVQCRAYFYPQHMRYVHHSWYIYGRVQNQWDRFSCLFYWRVGNCRVWYHGVSIPWNGYIRFF